MNADRVTCMLLEAAINGSTTNPHDSAEDAALRSQLAAHCAALTAGGTVVDIPSLRPHA